MCYLELSLVPGHEAVWSPVVVVCTCMQARHDVDVASNIISNCWQWNDVSGGLVLKITLPTYMVETCSIFRTVPPICINAI